MDKSKILVGNTALVTGGTSGIGFNTALWLVRLGAVLYITGRNMDRGQKAERQMRATSCQRNVYFIQADASTVGGNQELARRILMETHKLHILVNNVGGMYNDRWETDDGYEATLSQTPKMIAVFDLTNADA